MSVQVDIVDQTIEVQIVEDEVVNIAIWNGISVQANGTFVAKTRILNFSSGSSLSVSEEGNKVNIVIPTGGGGSGTVTSVGALSPLFTTANQTTTPTFTAVNQNANLVYAGPATGVAAAPTFRSLVSADLPSDSTAYWKTNGATTIATSVVTANTTNSVKVINTDASTESGLYINEQTNSLLRTGLVAFGDATVGMVGSNLTGTQYSAISSSKSGTVYETLLTAQGTDIGDITDEILFVIGRDSSFTAGQRSYATFTDNRTSKVGIQYFAAGYVTTDRSLTDRGYVLGAKTYTGLQTFRDDFFILQDDGDLTKQAQFQLSSITAGQTRTLTVPDANGTFAVSASGNIALSAAGNITFTGVLGPANGGTGVANNAASTLTISGNFATTLTVSGTTGVTLPTSGTLATTAQTWLLASGGALTGTNTISGAQTLAFTNTEVTFLSTVLKIRNPANTFQYTISAGAIGANRTVGIPVLGGTSFFLAGESAHMVANRLPYIAAADGQIISSANLTFVTNRLIGTTLYLTLSAGTATAGTCPFVMTSGTLLGTAIAGGVEYNNTFHMTNSDATRRHVVLAASATKTTAGAPYANDGYIVQNIGGTDVKIMTTA